MLCTKKIVTFFILVIFIVQNSILISCKKEKDTLSPDIALLSPSENGTFSVLDTIWVKAKVSDETQLEFIQISLLNTFGISVIPPVVIHPNKKDVSIQVPIVVQDVWLESGMYSLQVIASDGENHSSRNIVIYLGALPLKLRSVYALTKRNNGLLDLYSVDSAGVQHQATFQSDFAGMCIDSRNKILYISGKYSAEVKAYDISTMQEIWSISGSNNPPLSDFENIQLIDERLFVCYRNGYIRVFNSSGQQQLLLKSEQGYYPVGVCKTSKGFLVWEKSVVGSSGAIRLFYSSGSEQQHVLLPFQVVVAVPIKDNQAFLFTKSQTVNQIYIYSLENNVYTPISWAISQSAFMYAYPWGTDKVILANHFGVSYLDQTYPYHPADLFTGSVSVLKVPSYPPVDYYYAYASEHNLIQCFSPTQKFTSLLNDSIIAIDFLQEK